MSRIKRHQLRKSGQHTAPKKKKMSKQMIWTIIIGGLMVASVFGIMFSSYNSGSEQEIYGDYTFKRTGSGWATEIAGQKVEFAYLPQDLEELTIDQGVVETLAASKVVYITFDPNSTNVQKLELMRFELGNAFMQLFDMYAMPGITQESELYNQPIVDCSNATAVLPVVSIVETNETTARVEGGCVLLETEEYAALALKDRILYGMLGIIEN
jgi:hypothetical protein